MEKFSYLKCAAYLDSSLIFGIKPDLSRINEILRFLGDPHKKTGFVHIVGSNGKTSTTILTANVLQGQGLKAGYHISPHINEYTERIWYCGTPVGKERFARLFNDIYPSIIKVNEAGLGGALTQFEIITAMAFKLAADERLDVMVLEAGMGGRWDATNAADSVVCGITGVSLEHTAILGGTIKEIAVEKAQVIKNNSMVATTSCDPDVLEVLQDRVNLTGSRLFVYGKDFSITKREKQSLVGWNLDIKGLNATYKDLHINLVGNYQPANLSLAVVLSELYIALSGRKIDEKKLKTSLKKARVAGRFDVLSKIPVVIADASHNPEGINNFIKNINENFKDKKKIIVFSVLKDKDYKKMLSGIIKVSDVLILTSSNTTRSLPIEILKKELYKLLGEKKAAGKHTPAEIFEMDSISNSLKFALKISGSDDIICITGSITNLEHVL
jgi:dihydrofolate synthase / folylpolyglutamate synthase